MTNENQFHTPTLRTVDEALASSNANLELILESLRRTQRTLGIETPETEKEAAPLKASNNPFQRYEDKLIYTAKLHTDIREAIYSIEYALVGDEADSPKYGKTTKS